MTARIPFHVEGVGTFGILADYFSLVEPQLPQLAADLAAVELEVMLLPDARDPEGEQIWEFTPENGNAIRVERRLSRVCLGDADG